MNKKQQNRPIQQSFAIAEPNDKTNKTNEDVKEKLQKKKSKSMLEKIDLKDTASKSLNNVPPKRVSKNLSQLLHSRTDESIRDSLHNSNGSHEFLYWAEEGEHAEEIPNAKLKKHLSRTSFLIQDYREFKAAQSIQKAIRCWYCRTRYIKKKHAALVIQTAWRGFYARRFYYRKLEDTLQKCIVEHFNNAALKIQAFWRGFWVRENIHDQYRKKRMQMRAAEDLLHCVAFKLHHLLRTHQIPGIYSLRNSECLSKVEQLLYAMQFKQFNDRVRKLRTQRQNIIQTDIHTHKESAYMTEIPYAGPNFEGVCEPKCCDLMKDVDADAKMAKILSLYEKAARSDKRVERVRDRKEGEKKPTEGRKKKKKSDFCGDVIKSMKKWKILGCNKVTVSKDVFKCPENVEKFLIEIQSMNNIMQSRCHCHINVDKLVAAAK